MKKKLPVSLVIISVLCLAVIGLTIFSYLHLYNHNHYATQFEKKWYIIMILLQLPIVAGVVLMLMLKKTGLWIYLLGKVAFFALPLLANANVFGLAFPLFFIESATFFILFGKRVQYMN